MIKSKRNKYLLLSFLVLLAVSMACAVNVDKNPDGSLSVETTLSKALIEEAIVMSIDDPLVQKVAVTLNDGYVYVAGERQREGSDNVDTYSFQFTLDVIDGQLDATITEGRINGVSVSGDQLSAFNERIGGGLEQAGQAVENATLESVSIEPDGVVLNWRVEVGGGQ